MAAGNSRARWTPSLRSALTVLFLLMPTIAIGLVTAFAVVSYREAQRDALAEEARTILLLLVRHHPVMIGDASESSERLNAWAVRIAELPARQPRIKYAVLVDSAGADLSSGQLRRPEAALIPPDDALVEPGLFSFFGAPPIAHVAAHLPDVPDAVVQIGLDAGPGWAHLAHLQHIAGILAITLIANVWMIRRGLHRLIAPLEDVARESRALAEGREAHAVEVRGPTETRQVASTFNGMLARRTHDAERIESTLQRLRSEQTATEFERRRFSTMVAALHEGLLYFSPDGQVTYANPEAERLLGRSATDLRRISATRGAIANECADAGRVMAALIGEAAWRDVASKSQLDITMMTLRSGDSEDGGRMILMRDRTEETRLQRLLVEQDKIASVGMLAAGIAHEVNNPLDGLQNCLRRIIKDPTNTDQIERYAGLMTASLHHIETVVRQLLNLSHKRDRALRKIDVNETLRGAVELARAGQRWNGIEVDWELAHDLPPILADPQNLSQVFLNLVLNAVDAMAGGGTLSVRSHLGESRMASPGDADIVVEIRDTGCGIPGEVLPRVFEPFFTTKGHEKGTGLGLTVSRNLVIEHGGDIEVVTEIGVGSTMRVSLPRFFPKRVSISRSTEDGA